MYAAQEMAEARVPLVQAADQPVQDGSAGGLLCLSDCKGLHTLRDCRQDCASGSDAELVEAL